MTGINGGTLREWRRSRGWDVPEMARQLRQAADEPIAAHDGLLRMIRAWERGSHDLSERYELLYRRLGFGTPGPAESAARPEAAAVAGSAGLLDELVGYAVEFGRRAEVANVGSGTIHQLDDAIHRAAREYLTSSPGALLHRVGQITRQVFGLLQDRQRLRHTRDLYVIGAKCCAFLAWVAGDLGQLAAASAHGRTALILAEEAAHPGAEALALCALSKTAFWDGHLSRAGALARRGYERCPPNTTRVLLACQEADAASATEAQHAIGRARDARDEANTDDDLGGIFACGSVRLANYSAGVHLKTGEPDAALRAVDAAYPLPGEEIGYGTWGQLQISAGIAWLVKGDLDGTADRLSPVLALPAGQRLATLTGRLATLTPALTEGRYRTDRGASTLAGQISAYCDEAAGAMRLASPTGEETTG
ncbi:MAG TPA: hypothetical protein VIY52_07825 [Streptosporangiaceae bacterium]